MEHGNIRHKKSKIKLGYIENKEHDMVKKKHYLSLVLLTVLLVPSLCAYSPASETIWIQSELDKPIGVYCEFQYKDGNTISNFPTDWYQMIAGIEVKCKSLSEEKEREVFKPGARIYLVDYSPKPRYIGSIREDVDILAKIPLEQKLREVFKTLVITDADGVVLLTLDDFSKAKVEVGQNGDYQNGDYDIIIGEYLYQ